MELSIASQLLSLICFAALGLGLGLLYDVLRPLRYQNSGGFFWDMLFCSIAAFGCFTLAMGRGKANTWELAAALLFFCLYIHYLSPMLLPIFLGIFRFLHKSYGFLLHCLKKLKIIIKKFFTKRAD